MGSERLGGRSGWLLVLGCMIRRGRFEEDLRTRLVVMRVVRARMKVRMEMVAVVFRRGWLVGLEGDIVSFLVDWLTE